MYSTRLIHKNHDPENRYITVGDEFKDPLANCFRQPKKGEKPPVPFRTRDTVNANVEAGYFTKTAYRAGGYQEATRYLDKQPLDGRKRGFGTKDAHKRDEFSNGVRTEQYRESIRKEKYIIDKGAEHIKEQLTKLLETRSSMTISNANTTDASGFSYDQQVPQYDIGRSRVTQFDPKAAKDTFYKFSGDREKRLGGYRPVSMDCGDGAWSVTYKPPSHGGKSEVKNFYDKSHLSVKTF